MKKRYIAAICAIALLLSGCTAENKANPTDTAANLQTENTAQPQTNSADEAVQSAAEEITGTDISVSPMTGVEIKDNVYLITKGGSYTLSGSLADGQIIIDSDDDVELVLSGVNISNSTGPAIYAKNGDVTLVIVENSVNTLWDGEGYEVGDDENNPNAVIFTQDDLTISGRGTLNVKGSYKNAVNCKDKLLIEGGAIAVSAADNGIIGKDSVTITDGVITVTSAGDGIKSTASDDAEKGIVNISGGTVRVTSGEDGISAETNLDISGGAVDIVSGGGSTNAKEHTQSFGFHEISFDTSSDEASTKSLKGGSAVTISNADITLDSAEDCIHSNGTVTIESGSFEIISGDDGIHADQKLIINGGEINITKSYEGLESSAIEIGGGDIDIVSSDDGINVSSETDSDRMGANANSSNYLLIKGGNIYVNAEGDGLDMNGSGAVEGGTVIVDGPTNSGNGSLDYDGAFTVNGGTLITCGSSGMAMTPSSDSALNTLCITDSFSKGNAVSVKDSSGAEIISYTVNKTAGFITFTTDRLVTGETYTVSIDGTEKGSFTITEKISYIGEAIGQGGFGGGRGGFKENSGGGFGGEKPGRGNRPENSGDGTFPEGNGGTPPEKPADGTFPERNEGNPPEIPEGGNPT